MGIRKTGDRVTERQGDGRQETEDRETGREKEDSKTGRPEDMKTGRSATRRREM